MRAVICDTPGTLRLTERARPEPKEGEVVLRIRRMGVCGTDLHIFQGKHPYLEYPRVMGHELSGEVAAAGHGVRLAEGTPVYVMPYLTCGHCIACRQGKTNCCTSLQCLGVHCDGGMCEYLALPADRGVPDRRAAARPGGPGRVPGDRRPCGAAGRDPRRRTHAGRRRRPDRHRHGPVRPGARREVTFLDPARRPAGLLPRRAGPRRRPAGRRGHARAPARPHAGGDFFDLVFDATGNAAAMEQSFGWVAHGGTLVFVGVVRTDLRFSDPDFHKRELTLKGSRNATIEDFREVLAAIRSGRVQVERLITHRAGLAEAPEQFPAWIRPETGVVKAMIEI